MASGPKAIGRPTGLATRESPVESPLAARIRRIVPGPAGSRFSKENWSISHQ